MKTFSKLPILDSFVVMFSVTLFAYLQGFYCTECFVPSLRHFLYFATLFTFEWPTKSQTVHFLLRKYYDKDLSRNDVKFQDTTFVYSVGQVTFSYCVK